jgi:creatine kinase
MNKIFSFQKFPFKLCAAIAFGTIALKSFTETTPSFRPHHAALNNYSRKYYPASSEYPDIKKHRNIMARNLTENIYAKLRDLRTPNGFTIDDAIQTGVDNSGKFTTTGIVAGDEQSYQVFSDLFEKIILEKHGYKSNQQQKHDFDASKLKNGLFDSEYVLSIRLRTIRNLSGYCFPSFCTRGERRDIESIIVKSLYDLDEESKSVYYSLKDLNDDEEATLINVFLK